MRKLLLICLALACFSVYAQDVNVPFAQVEQVPVYPGCKGNNEKLKKCITSSISELVAKNFDFEYINNIGLPPGRLRMAATFKFSKTGEVTDINIKGDYLEANRELERVVKMIPNVEPGMQRGEKVDVLYGFPVVLDIKPKTTRKKKKGKG